MSKFVSNIVTYNFLVGRAKKLRSGWNGHGGRNASGKITSFRKGSFKTKRMYRFIDFWRRISNDAFLVKIEKDNFRSVKISLVLYQTGFLSYLVLPEGLKVGDRLRFNCDAANLHSSQLFSGNALPLRVIPSGSFVFNVELWPTKGAQVCRAAGTYAIVLGKSGDFVTLKLRSGWKMVVPADCFATLGIAPNYMHRYVIVRKAGTAVNLGRRPSVRGVAMNAVDHPHGGGRGKTSGGPQPRTPWGKIAKNRRTVLKKLRVAKIRIRYR